MIWGVLAYLVAVAIGCDVADAIFFAIVVMIIFED